MNDKNFQLAQKLRDAIPGTVRDAKCGKAKSDQVIVIALYNVLEEEGINGTISDTAGQAKEEANTTPSDS